jgi:hypothetical protein
VIAGGAGNIVAGNTSNFTPAAVTTLGNQSLAILPSGVIAAGAGNVIAAGAGNVIAAGAGNVIAAGAGNVIAAGAGNSLDVASPLAVGSFSTAYAARKARHPAKLVLLLAGAQVFNHAGKAQIELTFTKAGRKAMKQYAVLVRRLRKAHKRLPKASISVTFVIASRDGNGKGQPKAVFVTRTIQLRP